MESFLCYLILVSGDMVSCPLFMQCGDFSSQLYVNAQKKHIFAELHYGGVRLLIYCK